MAGKAVIDALAQGTLPEQESKWQKIAKYLINDSIPAQAVKSAWSGFTFPGDVLAGKADPYDYGRALDFAGGVTLGSAAIPAKAGEMRMGAGVGKRGIERLPRSSTLNLPEAPSLEALKKYALMENVPLSSARASQSKMSWDEFDAGRYAEAMFKGFEDAPVAVRKRDGEYIIFDGHHRTVKALNKGAPEMQMYVIDADKYDPSNAGLAANPSKPSWTQDDEELLRELGL